MEPVFILASIIAGVLANMVASWLGELLQAWKSENIKLELGGVQLEFKEASKDLQSQFKLLSSVVGIYDSEGRIVGSGFVIGSQKIVTTAHVIAHIGKGLNETVQLKFAVHDQLFVAIVKNILPEQDIALLELRGSLPQGVFPVKLSPEDQLSYRFRSFGFSNSFPNGLWITGDVLGPVRDVKKGQVVQLTSSNVQAGMSGAPIMDDNSKQVVGILQLVDSSSTPPTILALSTSELKKLAQV